MKRYIVLSSAFLMTFAMIKGQGSVLHEGYIGLSTPLANPPATTLQPVRSSTELTQPIRSTVRSTELTQPVRAIDIKSVQITDLNAARTGLNGFLQEVLASEDPLKKLQEVNKISTLNPVVKQYFTGLAEIYKALESQNPKQAATQLHQELIALQEKVKFAHPETKAAVQNLQAVTQQALANKSADLHAQALNLSLAGAFTQAASIAAQAKVFLDAVTKMAQPACQNIIRAVDAYNKYKQYLPAGK